MTTLHIKHSTCRVNCDGNLWPVTVVNGKEIYRCDKCGKHEVEDEIDLTFMENNHV